MTCRSARALPPPPGLLACFGISATSGGAAGNAYVQFGYAYDPLIFITNPVSGSASGFVEVDVAATNADGSEYPLSDIQLCIDGAPGGGTTIPDPDTGDAEPSGIETERLTNGQHVLRVACLNPDGDTVWSQNVRINVNNPISCLTPTCLEIFTDDASPNVISLNAQMSVPGTWSVEITDRYSNVVYSDSGAGPGTVAASWDGKQNGSYVDGIYTVTTNALDSTGAQLASKTLYATISPANAEALVCFEARDHEDRFAMDYLAEVTAVNDACRAQGITCTLVVDPIWVDRYVADGVETPGYPWGNDSEMGNLPRLSIGGWLVGPYHYFFYAAHGSLERQEYGEGRVCGPLRGRNDHSRR